MRSGSLLVIVPSRGRPANVARLIDGWARTATPELAASLLVAVDDDDPAKHDYLEAVHEVGFAWLEAGPRLGLGGTLNAKATAYASSFDAIGFLGDDHLPQTVGWDRRVLDALAELGAAGLVYGDDRFQGPALPTAVFASSCLVDALGYLVPPTMRHLFLDNYWLELGLRLDRIRYLPDVVIEHVHPAAGKAADDALYAENNRSEQWDADGAAWHAWKTGELDRDVERVRTHCEGAGG